MPTNDAKKTATPSTPEVTPISAWKTPALPIELPSGKFMQVRKSNFRAFIAAGIIPNSLMGTVQRSLQTGVQPDLNDLENTPEEVDEMLEMLDKVAVFVAQEPKLHDIPKMVRDKDSNGMIEGPRNPELLYVDEVDEEDKMFIFQYVTGSVKDLEQFRRESAEQLAALQSGQTMES